MASVALFVRCLLSAFIHGENLLNAVIFQQLLAVLVVMMPALIGMKNRRKAFFLQTTKIPPAFQLRDHGVEHTGFEPVTSTMRM